MEDVIANIEFLSRSPTRIRILELLNTNGRVEKHELIAKFDTSRTTITRNLEALAERGWIQTTNIESSITPTGREVVEDFLALTTTMDIAIRFEEFFKWIPAAEFDLDLQYLCDADLVVAQPGDPWAMITRHVSKLKTMEEGRSVLPLTGMHAAETASERILSAGASVELVIAPNVEATFRSDPYESLIGDLMETGRLDIYVYEGDFPFAINVIDETVQLIVAEGDEPRALLETDTTEVRKWALRRFDEYKRQAAPLF